MDTRKVNNKEYYLLDFVKMHFLMIFIGKLINFLIVTFFEMWNFLVKKKEDKQLDFIKSDGQEANYSQWKNMQPWEKWKFLIFAGLVCSILVLTSFFGLKYLMSFLLSWYVAGSIEVILKALGMAKLLLNPLYLLMILIFFEITKRSFLKNKYTNGLIVLTTIFFCISLLVYIVDNYLLEVNFDQEGNALKCATYTSEKGYILAPCDSAVHLTYGTKIVPLTDEIVVEMKMQSNAISKNTENWHGQKVSSFFTKDNKPLARYHVCDSGKIEMYPIEIHNHPKYGTPLKLVTRDIVILYEDQLEQEKLKNLQELNEKKKADTIKAKNKQSKLSLGLMDQEGNSEKDEDNLADTEQERLEAENAIEVIAQTQEKNELRIIDLSYDNYKENNSIQNVRIQYPKIYISDQNISKKINSQLESIIDDLRSYYINLFFNSFNNDKKYDLEIKMVKGYETDSALKFILIIFFKMYDDNNKATILLDDRTIEFDYNIIEHPDKIYYSSLDFMYNSNGTFRIYDLTNKVSFDLRKTSESDKVSFDLRKTSESNVVTVYFRFPGSYIEEYYATFYDNYEKQEIKATSKKEFKNVLRNRSYELNFMKTDKVWCLDSENKNPKFVVEYSFDNVNWHKLTVKDVQKTKNFWNFLLYVN